MPRHVGMRHEPTKGDAAQRSQVWHPRQETAAAPVEGSGGTRKAATCQQQLPKCSGADLFVQRAAEALHERGPRPVGELLAEVINRLSAEDADWLRQRLERYNRIPPETYAAVGARRFPAPPVREVRR